LSRADIGLGRLDGVVKVIPDPDFFVAMYVRREAVLSSQIEGTQSTLEDLLEIELDPRTRPGTDVGDIVNYVSAMNYGLRRLAELPLSLRLIREIHGELLRDGRGAHATPGEFRTTQNWIGAPAASLRRASFVPPPVPEMKDALANLETYLHRRDEPVLVKAAIAHAQFETIHPASSTATAASDACSSPSCSSTSASCANRCSTSATTSSSIGPSTTTGSPRSASAATGKDGCGSSWQASPRRLRRATNTAERIFELRERHRSLVIEQAGAHGLKLLAELYRRPLVNVNYVAEILGVTFPTANRLVASFEELGLLHEVTGQRRGPGLPLRRLPAPVRRRTDARSQRSDADHGDRRRNSSGTVNSSSAQPAFTSSRQSSGQISGSARRASPQ
jgi:Fic family protein